MGFLLTIIWTHTSVQCSFNNLMWNYVLLIINFVYSIWMGYQGLPTRFSKDFYELYEHDFMPLKISKKSFKELVKHAKLLCLSSGETYSIENKTKVNERLSILLKGKLKVSGFDDSIVLHHISPFEFIDSPEYEYYTKFIQDNDDSSSSDESVLLSQVTITAVEDCKIITWDRKLLIDDTFANHFRLKSVMENLIGNQNN